MLNPRDRLTTAIELTCSDCGSTFHPHQVSEGVEELCDACYEALFGHAVTSLPTAPAASETTEAFQPITAGQLAKAVDLVCTECRNTFTPHQMSEGVEELCDKCYEALFGHTVSFSPVPPPKAQKDHARKAA